MIFEKKSDSNGLKEYSVATGESLHIKHRARMENPTSEVEHVPNALLSSECESDAEKWKMLYDQQNKQFLELIKTLKAPNIDRIKFPQFDPDGTDVNAPAWISTADILMEGHILHGSALMLSLTQALKGQLLHGCLK